MDIALLVIGGGSLESLSVSGVVVAVMEYNNGYCPFLLELTVVAWPLKGIGYARNCC